MPIKEQVESFVRDLQDRSLSTVDFLALDSLELNQEEIQSIIDALLLKDEVIKIDFRTFLQDTRAASYFQSQMSHPVASDRAARFLRLECIHIDCTMTHTEEHDVDGNYKRPFTINAVQLHAILNAFPLESVLSIIELTNAELNQDLALFLSRSAITVKTLKLHGSVFGIGPNSKLLLRQDRLPQISPHYMGIDDTITERRAPNATQIAELLTILRGRDTEHPIQVNITNRNTDNLIRRFANRNDASNNAQRDSSASVASSTSVSSSTISASTDRRTRKNSQWSSIEQVGVEKTALQRELHIAMNEVLIAIENIIKPLPNVVNHTPLQRLQSALAEFYRSALVYNRDKGGASNKADNAHIDIMLANRRAALEYTLQQYALESEFTLPDDFNPDAPLDLSFSYVYMELFSIELKKRQQQTAVGEAVLIVFEALSELKSKDEQFNSRIAKKTEMGAFIRIFSSLAPAAAALAPMKHITPTQRAADSLIRLIDRINSARLNVEQETSPLIAQELLSFYRAAQRAHIEKLLKGDGSEPDDAQSIKGFLALFSPPQLSPKELNHEHLVRMYLHLRQYISQSDTAGKNPDSISTFREQAQRIHDVIKPIVENTPALNTARQEALPPDVVRQRTSSSWAGLFRGAVTTEKVKEPNIVAEKIIHYIQNNIDEDESELAFLIQSIQSFYFASLQYNTDKGAFRSNHEDMTHIKSFITTFCLNAAPLYSDPIKQLAQMHEMMQQHQPDNASTSFRNNIRRISYAITEAGAGLIPPNKPLPEIPAQSEPSGEEVSAPSMRR